MAKERSYKNPIPYASVSHNLSHLSNSNLDQGSANFGPQLNPTLWLVLCSLRGKNELYIIIFFKSSPKDMFIASLETEKGREKG